MSVHLPFSLPAVPRNLELPLIPYMSPASQLRKCHLRFRGKWRGRLGASRCRTHQVIPRWPPAYFSDGPHRMLCPLSSCPIPPQDGLTASLLGGSCGRWVSFPGPTAGAKPFVYKITGIPAFPWQGGGRQAGGLYRQPGGFLPLPFHYVFVQNWENVFTGEANSATEWN